MAEPPAAAETLAGRYVLRGELGRGGMATVYRGFDTVLEVERAIKLLHRKAMAAPNVRKRFLDEARTMARLRHPNLVPVHDLGLHDDRAFLVMELIDGGATSDRLKADGPFPVREAVRIVLDVLDGLTVAHDAGVVHRDVKPQNIILDRSGKAHLTDFGIARAAAREHDYTRTGARLGTLTYMPPEQRADPRQATPASDVFAMGATLYALVVARRPVDLYVAENLESRVTDLPAELADVLRGACAYEAAQRYPSAREMADALRAIQADLPDVTIRRSSRRPAPAPEPAPAPAPEPDVPSAVHPPSTTDEPPPPPWLWIGLGGFAVAAALAALATFLTRA